MSQLIAGIAGAPQAANTTGNFYTGAANDIYSQYNPSATSYFTNAQNLALRPQFQQQEAQLAGNEAAQGVTHSGAGINAFGNLGAAQAGALSSADAPLFSQGLNSASGVYAQMPGAQTQSYGDAINQFYQALQEGASFAGGMGGATPGGGGVTPAGNGPNGGFGPGAYYNPSTPGSSSTESGY
jgi:hypothetical protein